MAHILLIDDDDDLRGVIALALGTAGHRVTQAGDGREGIELYHDDPPDLVITDLVMPKQEGMETIIRLRGLHPRLPIIAISGGTLRSFDYLKAAGIVGANRTLFKPFSIADLLLEVSELLEKDAGAVPSSG